MKDIAVNPLTQGQRRILQLGVVFLLCIFLIGYFFMMSRTKNTTVYLQNETLQVFDETIPFAYPDKLELHFPYLLVVKPEEHKTLVYDLQEKQKKEEVQHVILDYAQEQSLYNEGASSFLKGVSLKALCVEGIIKSKSEILCVSDNKLLSVDPISKRQRILYISRYIITDLNLIGGKYYLGEIDPGTKKSYIVTGGKQITVPNVVSVIYELNGKPYFVSLKGALNPNKEEFYEIEQNNAVLRGENKIMLYE